MPIVILEANELVKTVGDLKSIEEDDTATIPISDKTLAVKEKLWRALTPDEQEEFNTTSVEEAHGPFLSYSGMRYKEVNLTTHEIFKTLSDFNEILGNVGALSRLTYNAVKKLWEALEPNEQKQFDGRYPNQHKPFLVAIGKKAKK
ncbi:hypothetical protein V7068_15400 [Bacillus sp. JJ634]